MNKTLYTSENRSLKRSKLWKSYQKTKDKEFPVFLSIPPGFSELALIETASKLSSIKNLHHTKGGLSLNTGLETILQANIVLGIPSRILVRLAKFRADNFSQLMKECEKLPFEFFLYNNLDLKIRTSFRKSKLRHGKAIEERVYAAIKKRLT